MFVLYVTLALAISLVGGAVVVFRWAVRDGQLDDLVTPAARILGEDSDPRSKS